MYNKRNRMTPEQRRLQILNTAIDVAVERGLYSTSMKNISMKGGMSVSIIRHYYPTLTVLREAIRGEAAVRRKAAHEGNRVEEFDMYSAVYEEYQAMQKAMRK